MRLWPRFVRTPWQWARDCYSVACGFIILVLLHDLLHQGSHAPWPCDDDCPYPWGKRHAVTDGLTGRGKP